MSLRKRFDAVNEDAAGGSTGAGSIASSPFGLFGAANQHMMARAQWKTKIGKGKVPKTPTYANSFKMKAFAALKEGSFSQSLGSDAGFDENQTLAAMKQHEKTERLDTKNTVSFGLKDDNGQIIEVTVSREEADEFEHALEGLLSAKQEQDAHGLDLAEILFQLKDSFTIYNVNWPKVEQDEEQESQVVQPEDGGDGSDSPDDVFGAGNSEPDAGLPPVPDDSTNSSAESMLQQVIDVMKADAEARKAEAKAKEAEAKAREASSIIRQTVSRVKQEEQFLDMEQQIKSKKEADKEAKRLAQLAAWKNEVSEDDPEIDTYDDDFSDVTPHQAVQQQPIPQQGPAQSTHQAPQFSDEETARPYVSKYRKSPTQPAGRMKSSAVADFILNRIGST